MTTSLIRLVPGPTIVPRDVLDVYSIDYGSADLEESFFSLYDEVCGEISELLFCPRGHGKVVVLSGEGMCALWAGLHSCVAAGDRVLSISTGLFGSGIADMAKSCGASVRVVSFPANSTVDDAGWARVESEAREFRPKMITVVHCETPSGTLNDVKKLAEIADRMDPRPLLYVDAVSSIGGAEVRVDWGLDIVLGGSQKCLSCPPTVCFLSVSDAAWRAIEEIKYRGYDALLPWKSGIALAPYTHNWHGVAALHVACRKLLSDGISESWRRHSRVSEHCRKRLAEIGLPSFYASGAVPSPTVTTSPLPRGIAWKELDAQLRARGVILGGSYGELESKVFRIGHMGSQADERLVDAAIEALSEIIKSHDKKQ